MREVQDALLAVVEEAEQEHEPHERVAHVAGARQERRPALHRAAQLPQAPFRASQVLDHVEGEDDVGFPAQGGGDVVAEGAIEVGRQVGKGEAGVGPRQVRGHDRDALAMEGTGHAPVTGAELEHPRARCPVAAEHLLVDRRGRLLEDVGAAVVHVELRMMDEVHAVGPGAQHRSDAVERVGNALDVADLVAVVGGDRHLDDPHPLGEQLDDDLGIEVEVAGVVLERDLRERRHPVGPVPGVELAQPGPQEPVLDRGQGPVAHELVQGHAAA